MDEQADCAVGQRLVPRCVSQSARCACGRFRWGRRVVMVLLLVMATTCQIGGLDL
ncbi:uncharacterized protein BKA78DRAFT_23000 [Phyllosticta capitalensis]|uniref:uncharacterized protein n=1 Tax=Phyllosticta capitalensis TaxID=121624 RepID=UPI00312FDCAA